MGKRIIVLIVATIGLLHLHAEPTKLLVRAKAKDAKFIGTGIGGAYVIVRNNITGEVLAKGSTTGASGNTDIIMKKPFSRGQSITDSATAKFEATIDINEPTFVDIEVLAPISRKSASVKGSTQIWLIPGKHILGEGIVIDVPGFIVDILTPNTHETIKLDTIKNGVLSFKASLTMMCGCPISKGGIWNSEDITINAIAKKDGVKIGEFPLHLTDHNNIFEGNLKVTDKGIYELVIYAYDPKTGNTGVDKINFVLQ